MSMANAEQLLKAIQRDPSLKAKIKQAPSFDKFAADAGYPCTAQEFADAIKAGVQKADLTKHVNDFVAAGIILTQVTTIF
jgi:predicted ribosomally synthesized peptide with nif11-like leader